MSQKSIQEQIAELQLEKEQLELIALRARVAEIKEKIARQAASHAQVERSIAEKKQQERSRQESCTHRMGGLGVDALAGQGNDANFAVIRHRMPFGDIITLCLRCHKLWRKGDADYAEGLKLPTKNTMSESCLFSKTVY